MAYTHILVAVAPLEEGAVLLGRAQALAQKLGARLSVLHVVELALPMNTLGAGGGLSAGGDDIGMINQVEITDSLLQSARQRVEALCEKFGIEAADVYVRVGGHAAEIITGAAEIAADLIVVGHQPHHGWSALFSHTEESVVHRARCDVLAIALDGATA
ncbi:MAG: universal stress protein [Nevskia sp.]|nr:universal stress protein [Nevskia sp.]